MPYSMRKREDLRDYQDGIIDLIDSAINESIPGLLLAIEMGLGKTITSLTAICAAMDAGTINKCLIVAPLRVAQNTWPEEFGSWEHLSDKAFAVMCGTKRRREAALDVDADFHIINRENLPWLYEELQRRGQRWPWDALIYDESSRLKSGRAKTGSGKMSEYGVILKASRFHKFQLLLTGTPTPNGIEDLWGQIKVIDGGERLGRTRTAFREEWMIPDYMGYNWRPRRGAVDEVMDIVSDVMISMSSDDHLDLPELVQDDIIIDLPPKILKGYKSFKRTFLEQQTDTLAVSAGVLAGKLLQYANGAIYTEEGSGAFEVIHDAKIKGLQELVERAGGENLLVGYGYKFDKTAILAAFPQAVAVEDDPQAIEKWNRGEIEMLIAHPASIGHGLNLQFGGRHVVWYGLTWSLELYEQFNARLRRSGQTADTVFLHHIIARHTIDETILRALEMRGATQEEIMDMVRAELDKSD